MHDDRFERALSESDATRLIVDARTDIRDERNRDIFDKWALSIASQLDESLESSGSFGEAQGDVDVTHSDHNTAALKYVRAGSVLRIVITANARLGANDNFGSGILVGDDFDLNSSIMHVEITRADINASASNVFRYALEPLTKFVSINTDQFLGLIEDLVRKAI